MLSKSPRLVHILDVIIAFTWVSHINVFCWRGTWTLVDLYVLPQYPLVSATATAVMGAVIRASIKCCMPLFQKHVTKDNMVKLLYVIVSRMMYYMMIIGTIMVWRGIWYLLDMSMDTEWKSNVLCLIVSLLIMWLFRISINAVLTPPMVIGFDQKHDLFYTEGRMQIKPNKPALYILDICISEAAVTTAVVSTWRGVWNLYNALVLPQYILYSNLLTWGVGNIICLLMVILQKHVASLCITCAKFSPGLAIAIEELYIAPVIGGVVAVWRGWWNIVQVILLPDPFIGGWVCHSVGTLGLMCTGMLSSVYDHSFAIDGQCSHNSIYWPQHFIRCILDQKASTVRTEEETKGNQHLQKEKDPFITSAGIEVVTEKSDNSNKNIEMNIIKRASHDDLTVSLHPVDVNSNQC